MKQKITTIRAPHSTRWRWGSESGMLVMGIGKRTRCLGNFSASVAVGSGSVVRWCRVRSGPPTFSSLSVPLLAFQAFLVNRRVVVVLFLGDMPFRSVTSCGGQMTWRCAVRAYIVRGAASCSVVCVGWGCTVCPPGSLVPVPPMMQRHTDVPPFRLS